jgi:hypothetical protein
MQILTIEEQNRALLRKLWERTEPIPHSGCWIWMGAISSNGYGNLGYDSVHSAAYKIIKGVVPPGLELDHKCRVRSCWNPDHLEPVTRRVNALRGNSLNAQNARKIHCKRGHLLEGDNLYTRKDRPNVRECRTCRIEHARGYNKNYRAPICHS